MRVVDTEFGDVLDGDDPLVVRHGRQHGREQRRFAAPGRPADQDVAALGHGLLDDPPRDALEGAAPVEPGERGPVGSGQSDGDRGAGDGDRREHDVHPDSVVVPDVGQRGGLVDVSAAAGDERCSEFACPPLVEDGIGPFEAGPAIDPGPATAHRQHVGDRGVPHEPGEFLELLRADRALGPRWSDTREERRRGEGTVSMHGRDATARTTRGSAPAVCGAERRFLPTNGHCCPPLQKAVPQSVAGVHGSGGTRRARPVQVGVRQATARATRTHRCVSMDRSVHQSAYPRGSSRDATVRPPRPSGCLPGEKKRRHLLGGTGAAWTPADWGESRPTPPETSPAMNTVPHEHPCSATPTRRPAATGRG
ncbi:hypothetical protein JOE58_001396 [Curtobacterium luteum]|uniref:Uncharacterized protein n=1 Tax=Curtobacterium luteum TaxID=33881 RepID=A0ABS2RT08_9MICO|nr:hypothetical protein [Curtobacterium luteum]